MYLMNTRLDILFSMNTLRHVHLMIANHALRYLKGTVDDGLKYEVNQNINLEGYVDWDWASSTIYRKSTSTCFFSMGLGVIYWFSRKQSCVALSTTEAEYVAACSASCEAVWLQKLLSNIFDLQLDATCIHCDNQSCVKLSKNPVLHDWSKLPYVAMNDQIADVLTKPLARVKFEYFRGKLVVLQIEVPYKGK